MGAKKAAAKERGAVGELLKTAFVVGAVVVAASITSDILIPD